ncbi:hypothetical protein [Pontibacter anaerobius]|uniref:Uncharacterized protein n=1 Tax=Pontibacter anaerobius TaxID=2993940 RepID=A0ABT3RJH8_9BACT|nr:hypothetical protein [Pontibacter anaerobius]MCX2742013.1 hypothetical protein [Pontibacter anaerobius]
MKTDKKDWDKTAQDAKGDLKTGRIPDKHTGEQYRNVSDKNRNDPAPVKGEPKQGKQDEPKAHHTSQGHSSEGHEESQRSSTTDSSREPKNPRDDMPTGGNVR